MGANMPWRLSGTLCRRKLERSAIPQDRTQLAAKGHFLMTTAFA
jgi:hypothetical protein